MTWGERRTAAGWAFAAFAAGASLLSAWLPPAIAAAFLGITFMFTPGALAARVLLVKGDSLPREAAAFAWSPFLAGGVIVALAALGLPFTTAVRLTVLGIGLLAACCAVRPAGRVLSGTPKAELVAPLVWTTVVAALLVGVTALPLRSDGWFHAAVTLQIAERGIVPEDPYFAGLRLLYFWGEHAWAAGWLVLAPGLKPTTPLVACNLAAAFAVALAVAALARRLGGSVRDARFAVVLMVIGYAPFAWIQVAGRAVMGTVRGWPEVMRLAGAGPDAALDMLGQGLLHASLAFFGDKYLVVTPFAMGFALLLLAVLALIDVTDSPSVRRNAVLAVTLAAALYTHSVVGYCALSMVGVWWGWSAMEAFRGDAASRARLVPLAIAATLTLGLVAPYLISIAAGKQALVRLGFTMTALRSAVVGGAAIVPAALVWLSMRARPMPAARMLLLGAGMLLMMGLVVRLPENNQSKFFNLLWLLLAAPAALAWRDLAARAPSRWRLALPALGVIALLPTVVLCLWAFALERGQSPSTVRRSTLAELEALRWLREHTTADAMLCDLGGARDLLTVTGRSVLWGGPGGERDWGYAPKALALRRETVRALCRGQEPSSAGRAWLATMARPMLIVARAASPDSLSGWDLLPMRPERFQPVFRNSEMAFYRWEGAR